MGEEGRYGGVDEEGSGGGGRDCCPHLLATAVTEALVDQINTGRIAAERVGHREVARPGNGTWRWGLSARQGVHDIGRKTDKEKENKKISREGRGGVGRFGMMTAGLRAGKHRDDVSEGKDHSGSESKPEGTDPGTRNWKQDIRNEARNVVQGMAGFNQAGWRREEGRGQYNGLAYASAYTGL